MVVHNVRSGFGSSFVFYFVADQALTATAAAADLISFAHFQHTSKFKLFSSLSLYLILPTEHI